MASPLAIMWIMTGGNCPPAASARASGAPSLTREMASCTLFFKASFDSVCAPASSARISGTPLLVRMPSVDAKRAVLSPRASRPAIGSVSTRRCHASRKAGERSASRKPSSAAASATSTSQPQERTKSDTAISAIVRKGRSCLVCWKTLTTCGTT